MELRILNYFLMVAREENITKAAQLLHISQPTLSRQLMQLEEELGVKLFVRKSHHISLTDDGILLKRRAGELIALAEKTRQEFSTHEDELIGEISIGAGELLSLDCLADIMVGFKKKYPYVNFDLHSGNADAITEKIEQGSLDIGLLLEPIDISKYEFYRLSVKEQWGILVCEQSPLLEREFIMPEDIIHKPLIIPKRTYVRRELENWFGEFYKDLNFIITYDLLYNAAMMVQKHMGAAICLNLKTEFDGLKFIPLKPAIESSSALVWKKDIPFSKAVSAFIEFIHEMPK